MDDVECLERTWCKGMPDSSDLIAEVQAQLRSALAALPESDPPDHNCPVGARVRVRFGEEEDAEWFEGYLVERRASDGKFLCIFDEDDGEEYWYALGEPDFEILGL